MDRPLCSCRGRICRKSRRRSDEGFGGHLAFLSASWRKMHVGEAFPTTPWKCSDAAIERRAVVARRFVY